MKPRKLFSQIGHWLNGPLPAIVLSTLALFVSWRSYQHSMALSKPIPRLEVYDVVTRPGGIVGFNYQEYWVRCRIANDGGQATTLMHIEPDTCCHWLLGVDSMNQGIHLDDRIQLYLATGSFASYRSLPSTDTLPSLPKDDAIQIGRKVEPGEAYSMSIGIREYPSGTFGYNSIQLRMVAVFSDGTRQPFSSEWSIRR
jgi:hypothetical protein